MDNKNLYDNGLIINYDDGTSSIERFPVEYTESIDDISHTVVEGNTLLNLAHKYYKDSKLWYKLAERNNLDDIFNLEEGSELIIPINKNF